MAGARDIDGAKYIIMMRNKNIRIGHLPGNSKDEARPVEPEGQRKAVFGKIGLAVTADLKVKNYSPVNM